MGTDRIFKLIIGNHDSVNFKIKNLDILKYWNISPFYFSHYPVEETKIFNLCGHIHPSFLLKGKGKQKIKLPCFYISKKNIIFPSFGEFTGTHNLKLENNGDEFILISKKFGPSLFKKFKNFELKFLLFLIR